MDTTESLLRSRYNWTVDEADALLARLDSSLAML